MTSSLPDTVTATTNKDLVQLSSLFFDDAIFSIMRELIQNSRRAGATKATIDYLKDGESSLWLYKDNGDGCMPQDLMEFGGTCWDDNVKKSETPAGIGFFALSRRNPVVSSPKCRWMLSLKEKNFQGTPAHVTTLTGVPEEEEQWGFRCSFDGKPEDRDATGQGYQGLNEFWYPLTACCGMEIIFSGKPLPQVADFLAPPFGITLCSDLMEVVPGIRMMVFLEKDSGSCPTPSLGVNHQILIGGAVYNGHAVSSLSNLPYGMRYFSRIMVDREALLPLELPQRNKFIQTDNLRAIQLTYKHTALDLYAKALAGRHCDIGLRYWEDAMAEGYKGAFQLPTLVGSVRRAETLDPYAPNSWNFSKETCYLAAVSDLPTGPVMQVSNGEKLLFQLPITLFKPMDWFCTLLMLISDRRTLEVEYPLLSAKFPEWFSHLKLLILAYRNEPELTLEIIEEDETRELVIASGMDDSELFLELGSEKVVDRMVLHSLSMSGGTAEDVLCLWDTTKYEDVGRNWHVTKAWIEDVDAVDFVQELYEPFDVSSEDEEDRYNSAKYLEGILHKHQNGDSKEWVIQQLRSRLYHINHDIPQLDELLDTHRLVVSIGGAKKERVLTVELIPQEPV